MVSCQASDRVSGPCDFANRVIEIAMYQFEGGDCLGTFGICKAVSDGSCNDMMDVRLDSGGVGLVECNTESL